MTERRSLTLPDNSGLYLSFCVACHPHGSVLGHILFLLYTADVTAIAQRHGFSAHSYADDTQLYLHVKAASCETELLRLRECISDIDSWMSSNRLRMNADKTQFIWLGS